MRIPIRETLKTLTLLLLIWLVGAGCASNPLSESVPYGFDLSGNWSLIAESSDDAPDLDEISADEIAKEKRGKKIDSRSSLSFLIQDFPVLVSDSLAIQQDSTSMGVRYSNSFYREVSWGNQNLGDWKVNSGWKQGDLVLLMSRRNVNARESFALSDRNQRLTVVVYIKTPLDKMTLERVFRRH